MRRVGEEGAPAQNSVAAQLPEGVSDLAEIVRTLDAENLPIADLRLHAPSLDDVFLAKTGRSLEGAGDEGSDDEDDRDDQAGEAGKATGPTDGMPAGEGVGAGGGGRAGR